MKRDTVVEFVGLELPSRKIIKEVERGGYRYLRILDLDKIKDEEMKQQLKKEYKRRLQLILSSKLHGRNKQDHGSHYMGGCCAAVRSRSS